MGMSTPSRWSDFLLSSTMHRLALSALTPSPLKKATMWARERRKEKPNSHRMVERRRTKRNATMVLSRQKTSRRVTSCRTMLMGWEELGSVVGEEMKKRKGNMAGGGEEEDERTQ
jgi:hypothetical protein